MNPELPVTDDTPIWDAWLGMLQTPVVSVALELDLFESLREPADMDTLAGRTGYSVRGLSAVLGMLRCLRLVDRHEGQQRERRVTQPAVAIIPIACAAELFGK